MAPNENDNSWIDDFPKCSHGYLVIGMVIDY